MTRPHARRQRGFALVVVLILLAVATLLALAAVQQGTGQERIAANYRNRSLALEGAEIAARSAERWLYVKAERAGGAALVLGGDGITSRVYATGALEASPTGREFLKPRVWSTAAGTAVPMSEFAFNAGDASARLAAQPVYVIEDLGRLRPRGAGRIGEGGATGNTGYEGSAAMSPAGNADLRVFRTFGKSLGPGADEASAFTVTVWSIFAGRVQG
jgi:Tfp pilus assembly protein PilX